MACASGYGNTGTVGDACDIQKIIGFIITPESTTYTKATYVNNIEAFAAKLGTDSIAALPAQRIYPYLFNTGFIDNTAANTVQTAEFGDVIHVEHGKPSFRVRLGERGYRQLMNLDKFRGSSVRLFLITASGKMIGEKNTSDTEFRGHKVTVAAEGKLPQAMNTSDKFVDFYYENEDAFYDVNTFDFYDFGSKNVLKDAMTGVHDVLLELVSASTSAIVVRAKLAANRQDMGARGYEAAMEQPGAWLLVLNSTGAAVTVSTVTYSSTAGTFTLAGTFTTALHHLSLKDPTTLAALAIPFGNAATGGFESNVISVTPA